MEDDQGSALFGAVADWAISLGEVKLNERPGIWYRRTEKVGELGPLDVRVNAHANEIDGIPPYTAKISMDDYFPGIIAIVNPFDGVVMRSLNEGENEDGLIAHFYAQPSHKQSDDRTDASGSSPDA